MNIFNRKPKEYPKYCKSCGCPITSQWFVKKTSDFDEETGLATEQQYEEMRCSNKNIWIFCYKQKTGAQKKVIIQGNCNDKEYIASKGKTE